MVSAAAARGFYVLSLFGSAEQQEGPPLIGVYQECNLSYLTKYNMDCRYSQPREVEYNISLESIVRMYF
jgi:hypothetical protein